jgi:uncharacterized membrane protein YkoI
MIRTLALGIALVGLVGAANTRTEKLLNAAKITLAQAVNTATADGKDGTALGGRIKAGKDESILYTITVARCTSTFNVSIDAKTGAVLSSVDAKKDRSKVAERVKLSLAKASEIAVAKAGKGTGKASGGKLEISRTRALFEVKVVEAGKADEVEVDAATGNVIEVEDDDDDDDDDDDEDDDDDDDDDDD